MANTAIATLTEDMSAQALMLATGQAQEKSGPEVPYLKINYDDEDTNGNELKRGQWILETDDGIFQSKQASVRILASYFQYFHYTYDEAEKKGEMISESVMFHDFRSDVPSTDGTQKCGKPDRKTFDKLTDVEKEKYKDIKCRRILFCLANFEGKEYPCVYYAKGTAWGPAQDYIDSLSSTNTPMQATETLIGTHKEKNTTFWVPVFEKGADLPITKDILERVSEIMQWVNSKNEDITAKYHAALNRKAKHTIDSSVDVGVDDELNDDIPWNND